MSTGFTFGSAATPKTTGIGFGSTTVTPTFGNPAQGTPSAGLTFSSLAQSSLPFGTPQPQQQQHQQQQQQQQQQLQLQQQQPQASGITFGTPANTQAALSFGTGAPSTTHTGLTFATPATTQAGLSFGTPATSTTLFGGTIASFGQSGLNFGTAIPAPTTTTTATNTATAAATTTAAAAAAATSGSLAPTPQTGFSFGAPTAATSATTAFGTPLSSTTFGTPAALAGFGTPVTSSTFGAPATSTAFGTPITSSTFGTSGLSSSFGTTTTSSAFGTSATPAFGSVPAAAGVTTAAGSGFGLSTTPQFGVATTTSAFGLPSTSTVTGQAASTTAASSLGFGLSFGAPNTTVTSTPLSFGLGTTATTTKSLGLFSSSAPTTTTGLGFGSPSVTTQSTGFGLGTGTNIFGMGGKTFGSPGSSTAPPTTATSTTASIGLGGLDPSQNKLGLAGTGTSRTDNKAAKENQVPNAIVETVDNFKNFLKAQKNLSSDIARGSAKPLNKVQEETENLKQNLASLQNGIQRSSALVVKLKSDTAKCLQNAEMAQRTHETPPGLQYDNTAPLKYFQDLVANFEHEMKVFKLEINNTEKHLHSLMQPMPLTSQELSLAMRRLHDSFVALAGRLQSVHNSVETEKNQYLLLRKNFLKDSSNVFEEEAKKSVLASSKTKSSSKLSAGPTPFSALGGQHGFGLLSSSSTLSKPSLSSGWSGSQTPRPQLQQPQQQQPPTQFQQSQFSTPTLSNTLFSGANASSLINLQPVENQSFQLQKPPLGNKRGKR